MAQKSKQSQAEHKVGMREEEKRESDGAILYMVFQEST